MTSELASNAVEHARTEFDVVVEVNAALIRVEIHDGLAVSTAFASLIANPPHAVEAHGLNGRGLMLVHAVALHCGVLDKGHQGKAVWFEVGAT